MVSPLAFDVLRRCYFLPVLAAQDADKPAHRVACQQVASTISASVTPLASFIVAITSAFLLLRCVARGYARRGMRDDAARSVIVPLGVGYR